MTHEKIHTIHLTPHITWQGTRAELEAMQAEGWPLVDARAERIKELLAEARADRIEELERNISAARNQLDRLARWLDLSDEELNRLPIGSIVDDHRELQAHVNAAIAELKGENDE
jgi:hypothetical protein